MLMERKEGPGGGGVSVSRLHSVNTSCHNCPSPREEMPLRDEWYSDQKIRSC